jgi:hypothetical protein
MFVPMEDHGVFGVPPLVGALGLVSRPRRMSARVAARSSFLLQLPAVRKNVAAGPVFHVEHF